MVELKHLGIANPKHAKIFCFFTTHCKSNQLKLILHYYLRLFLLGDENF
jgi:hypothetical protein